MLSDEFLDMCYYEYLLENKKDITFEEYVEQRLMQMKRLIGFLTKG